MRKQRLISLCLASALALSLAACNSPTDEQTSAQPTPSTQPTAAPTPTPTPPIPFTDVAQDSPYYDAVVWAYKNGIASDGETFGPADVCTRGQVMTFLWRAKGSPEPQTTESPFSDVSSDDWFCKSALWAFEKGIATGTAFNPGNPCTNGEALTFLWRAEGKPAASVYHSSVALAASGQYYARPAAWAEANGLFFGGDFDPAAPCSRAELMAYLHWGTEKWTFAEEDKAVQAEYEQIINDAQLYEVHGSGLVYADYVDVDNDGKVELLTIGFGENVFTSTITVYANIDGHAKKFCEGTVESYFWKENEFSICRTGGELYLHTHGKVYSQTWGGDIEGAEEHQFFKIEKGNFALEDGFSIGINGVADEVFDYVSKQQITTNECKAILQKYTDEKGPFTRCCINLDQPDQVVILDRGLLPSPEEYQLAYWSAVDPVYGAVLKGDFSAFAGTYKPYSKEYSEYFGSLVLDKNGVLTGDSSILAVKPSSVTITQEGVIRCVLEETTELIDGKQITTGKIYEICPVGIETNYYNVETGDDFTTDKLGVQIIYNWINGYTAPFRMLYKEP